MQNEAFDRVEITEPEEILSDDRSGLLALMLGAISGASVVGLIWLLAVLLF